MKTESSAPSQLSESSPGFRRKALVGLLERKPRWGLSGRGWLTILGLAFVVSLGVICFIRPFLAVTDRVDTRTLVVEGWVHEYAIIDAVTEFRVGGYTNIFTTGGPVEGLGGYVNDFQTAASVGADLLLKNGIPEKSLHMVPSHVLDRDRTYSSAVALRNWFRAHNLPVDGINVLTEGSHARRTRLLFQEALGPGVKVGIISVANPDYDPKKWWRYSDGVREVSSEALAYLYAKFLFWPAKESPVK